MTTQIIYAQQLNGKIIKIDPAHSYLDDWARQYQITLYRFDKNSLDHTLFLLKYSDHIENHNHSGSVK